MVNVAENGVNVYEQNKHYEVAPVLSMTQHEANNNCIWVSDKTWNSLSDQEKTWVQEAADEIAPARAGLGASSSRQDSAAKLKKIGVKVVEKVDKSGFHEGRRAHPGPAGEGARARTRSRSSVSSAT